MTLLSEVRPDPAAIAEFRLDPAAIASPARNHDAGKSEESSSGHVYHSLVVDSGPLIRLAGAASLWKRAKSFYTVPAVLQEIRDIKAREHLKTLPFELQVRDASSEGVRAVTQFARQTGDYHSLSSVDLQVLGLLYDLEREARLGDMSHVRTTPKRVLGLGPITTTIRPSEISADRAFELMNGDDIESVSSVDYSSSGDDIDADSYISGTNETFEAASIHMDQPRSWATIVDPTAKDMPKAPVSSDDSSVINDALHSRLGRMELAVSKKKVEDDELGGQFSDAEEDVDVNDNLDETSGFGPELHLNFPSLGASKIVDHVVNSECIEPPGDATERRRLARETEDARKQQSLRPVSNSGKLYNSFRKYSDLMKPKQQPKIAAVDVKSVLVAPSSLSTVKQPTGASPSTNQSRIIAGMTVAGQEVQVEDDGEGWITSTDEICARKAGGSLDPSKMGSAFSESQPPNGPPTYERSACATTDFAMQNVILQMNFELLSVDGMKVRKLKSFVTRCGACYKVYTSDDCTGPVAKRLFCDRCGSDMMQRIAASVDGRTGRLRLHLSKRYKHNLRGTKFSLPKPGTGNRFKGDLLLREDQLYMGAWNQKVKMSSGGKARESAQSIFGKDIASSMGCNAKVVDEDIRVGFGRRNPNAARGRERRGKRKKTSDKACGLRRY